MYRFTLFTSALALAAGTAHGADDELLVFDYSGFEDPEFHQPYVAAHGDSPAFSFFGDEEEAFQKIVGGFRADVTHVCAGSVNKWVEAEIVEPWDTGLIPTFADLDADLVGSEIAPGDAAFFIPTDFGSTAIAYNPDEVPEDAVQTLEVFNDPAYAGRLSIPDNVDDAYALAYLAVGVTDWTTATDEEFEAASDWLRGVHNNLRTYWVDVAELTQLMATGEVLVAWAWNEVFPALVEEGLPAGFEREPAEGSSLWLCGYVNMADGPGSEEKAYDYLNALLDPVSTEPLLVSGFGHANRSGMGAFSQEELAASGLEAIDAPVLAQLPLPVAVREKHSEEFERIKAGF
ncbi:MAG: extracellular solute-binding protein [Paracoccaceae bacterium]|nr:extracellular solute-binding protein [Paracoccaceae bacterium]